MQHDALSKLEQSLAVFLISLAGCGCRCLEFCFAVGQPVGFENRRIAAGILAHENEIAVICDEYLAISVPVPGDLFCFGCHPSVVLGRLDLDGATGRKLAGQWRIIGNSLELLGSEEAAIRFACTSVRELEDTLNLRLELFSEFIQEGCQGMIIGLLLDSRSCAPNLTELSQVGFESRHVHEIVSISV
jgi:hypothetical protein